MRTTTTAESLGMRITGIREPPVIWRFQFRLSVRLVRKETVNRRTEIGQPNIHEPWTRTRATTTFTFASKAIITHTRAHTHNSENLFRAAHNRALGHLCESCANANHAPHSVWRLAVLITAESWPQIADEARIIIWSVCVCVRVYDVPLEWLRKIYMRPRFGTDLISPPANNGLVCARTGLNCAVKRIATGRQLRKKERNARSIDYKSYVTCHDGGKQSRLFVAIHSYFRL